MFLERTWFAQNDPIKISQLFQEKDYKQCRIAVTKRTQNMVDTYETHV